MTSDGNGAAHGGIFIFWHIFAPPERRARLEQILSRQFSVLAESGLLDACSGLFVGLVGTGVTSTLSDILTHPKATVASRAESGNEEVTTSKLKDFADRSSAPCRIFYMHARGITHDPQSTTGLAHDDWSKMMEFFTITRWRKAVEVLKDHYAAGCEMWGYPHRTRPGDFSFHYAGNFWWTTSEYVKKLDSPLLYVPNRSLVSEDWILKLAGKGVSIGKFYVLHRTSKHKYTRGMINYYMDRYPPEFYLSGSELPDLPIDPSTTHGEKE